MAGRWPLIDRSAIRYNTSPRATISAPRYSRRSPRRPSAAIMAEPITDQAQAVTFAGQIAALLDLPMIDLRGELDQ